MKGIFLVLVENKSGVLSKTAGLFARRGFNIDTLAVGETDKHTTSCITIVSNGDEKIIEQIEKQLNKKIDVIKVKRLEEEKCIRRELLLVKVSYKRNNLKDIVEVCKIINARIANVSMHSLIVELCDTPENVVNFIRLIQPFGILEISRTGMVALQEESLSGNEAR